MPLNLTLIKYLDYYLVHNHCNHPQYFCYYKGHGKHKTLNILHVQSSSYILQFDMAYLKNNHIGSIVVLLQGLVQHLMGESQDQSSWIAHHMSSHDQQEIALVGVAHQKIEIELQLVVLFSHAL